MQTRHAGSSLYSKTGWPSCPRAEASPLLAFVIIASVFKTCTTVTESPLCSKRTGQLWHVTGAMLEPEPAEVVGYIKQRRSQGGVRAGRAYGFTKRIAISNDFW